MKTRTTHQKLTKEMKKENLLKLRKMINDNNLDDLNFLNREWGGEEIIITSSPERVFNPETDEDDWFGRRSACTYVLTKHAMLLSNLFYYVNVNIMTGRDFYLYNFMAYLAIDYINQFGDENPIQLISHVVYGVAAYCKYYDFKVGSRKTILNFMKFFLSDEKIIKR